MKIGFIGAGNMAQAMIRGIIKSEIVTPDQITVSAPSVKSRDKISKLGVKVTSNNLEVALSDVVFIAVKPYLYKEIIQEIKSTVNNNTVVISIAPGILLDKLREWFGGPVQLIRTMPNTPALVGQGVTAFCPADDVTQFNTDYVTRVLESFGSAVLMPEKLMDAVSGLSGSGPAYVYIFIEAMAQAGIQAGLQKDQAYELAAQTVIGSAKMVLETGLSPGELRDNVCSPGGSTIEGVRKLEENSFRSAVIEGVLAGIKRAKELGNQ